MKVKRWSYHRGLGDGQQRQERITPGARPGKPPPTAQAAVVLCPDAAAPLPTQLLPPVYHQPLQLNTGPEPQNFVRR